MDDYWANWVLGASSTLKRGVIDRPAGQIVVMMMMMMIGLAMRLRNMRQIFRHMRRRLQNMRFMRMMGIGRCIRMANPNRQ